MGRGGARRRGPPRLAAPPARGPRGRRHRLTRPRPRLRPRAHRSWVRQAADDPELAALVGELSVKSEDFRRWWADHNVKDKSNGRKVLHHPLVGDLVLDYESLRLPDDPDQVLVTYTVEANSPSETNLRLLASWNTEAPVA
ncbi:hypothetical protein GCM10023195_41620 [Actinoallomurus liliacearum]|uniref:MmyB-like transcription regulator ligand binding domain-containing protein n=1 Tax=Actinoallomurus liliacearum TaxID=1080073 RepID=A0ABP8TQ57_9ACTN